MSVNGGLTRQLTEESPSGGGCQPSRVLPGRTGWSGKRRGRAASSAARTWSQLDRSCCRAARPTYANGQRYIYNEGPERQTYSDPDAS
jgi:hypothetical protein